VAAGQARISAGLLTRALDDREVAQPLLIAGLAPACGLTLVDVYYDNLA
jgi:hypothetical protein